MLTMPLVLSFTIASVGATSAGADAKVRATFDRYKKAAMAADGQAAARELDANTVAYYAGLRTAALSAPDVHGLPPTDKLMILRLRLELAPDQLSSFDGRSLIAYAISKGWAGSAQIGATTVGKITVDGARAEAELSANGKPLGAHLTFRREKTDWKLDLTANNDNARTAFSATRARSKLGEDELILKMLRETTGQPISDKVWRPLVPNLRR